MRHRAVASPALLALNTLLAVSFALVGLRMLTAGRGTVWVLTGVCVLVLAAVVALAPRDWPVGAQAVVAMALWRGSTWSPSSRWR